MDDLNKAEIKSAEAVDATAAAQKAVEDARAAQIEGALESAMEKFFSRGIGEKRFVDVGRIPFICDDIRGIRATIESLQSDLRWMKWLGSGFVVAAGLLALKSLGL